MTDLTVNPQSFGMLRAHSSSPGSSSPTPGVVAVAQSAATALDQAATPTGTVGARAEATGANSESAVPRVNTSASACAYIKRDRMPCKFASLPSSNFCFHHLPDRIPCPLDPSHSVLPHKLKRHLKACPKGTQQARLAAMPFFAKDLNAGADQLCDASAVESSPRDDIAAPDPTRLLALAERVLSAVATVGVHGQSPGAVRRSAAPLPASKIQKHATQNAAIGDAAARLGLLDARRTMVLELGAGTAKLSAALVDCIRGNSAEARETAVVLVDRIRPKSCVDSKMREMGARVSRLRMDLRHLRLAGVQEVSSPWGAQASDRTAPVAAMPAVKRLAFAKHLCGEATDFALRSMVVADAPRMDGIVVATCCHHRCRWESLVGRPLLQRLGFTAADFLLLTRLSGWATNRASLREPGAARADNDGEHAVDDDVTRSLASSVAETLGPAERERVGRACKRLIDAARLSYLDEWRYRGWMEEYVPTEVSPENVLLVGMPTEDSIGLMCLPCDPRSFGST